MIEVTPSKNGRVIFLKFRNDLTPGLYQGTNRGCHLIGDVLNFGKQVWVNPYGITLLPKWKSDVPRILPQIQELMTNWRWQFAFRCWSNRCTQ